MEALAKTVKLCQKTLKKCEEKLSRKETEVRDVINAIKEILPVDRKMPRPLRVASWNIKSFKARREVSDEKIERVSATIIDGDFDVIAIQEVGVYQIEILKRKNCIRKLVDALNNESGEKWKCAISCQNLHREYGAFVWNTGGDRSLDLKCTYVINLNFMGKNKIEYKLERKPFVGEFKFGSWNFSLVSFHLFCATGRSKGKKKKEINEHECNILPTIATIAKITQKQDVILLGDFNCIPPASILKKVGYVSLFKNKKYTNTAKNKCFDNILIHSSLWINYDQHSVADIKVCTEKNPSFFQAMRQNVSDHCPIFADFV